MCGDDHGDEHNHGDNHGGDCIIIAAADDDDDACPRLLTIVTSQMGVRGDAQLGLLKLAWKLVL